MLAIGLVKTWLAQRPPGAGRSLRPALLAATTTARLWMLMRAFASGCTAMTGVEAVSNGVAAFREPAVHNARRTLDGDHRHPRRPARRHRLPRRAYGIGATEPGVGGYQSVLSQLVAAVVGTRAVLLHQHRARCSAVLALSANTGFADFPRLCRLIAQDGFLPRVFASRGRRLVYSLGIYVLDRSCRRSC